MGLVAFVQSRFYRRFDIGLEVQGSHERRILAPRWVEVVEFVEELGVVDVDLVGIESDDGTKVLMHLLQFDVVAAQHVES